MSVVQKESKTQTECQGSIENSGAKGFWAAGWTETYHNTAI